MAREAPRQRGFDAELAAVDAVSGLSAEEALPVLRKALASRNNLIVSRAAKHAARLGLVSLAEDIARAFPRFMPEAGDSVKMDPQCWAKNEIVKALAAFEYQDSAVFLAGLHYHQHEPVWGGSSDTAGALRGQCALALVQCREVPSNAVLRHLLPLFADKDTPVRVNAVRAAEQVGTEAAALLLRLRAELGSDELEVLGACIGGVLRLDGKAALPWVAGFLAEGDDIAAEAAFVLAEHRSVEAFHLLQLAYEKSRERNCKTTLLNAMAASHLPEATEWLLARVESGALDAQATAQALWEARPSDEIAQRLLSLGFVRKHS